jgi:hypothetical protein
VIPLNPYKQLVVERLEQKGMEPSLIPTFIKNLAKTLLVNPQESLFQVNARLQFLGWGDVELDYRTYELAEACFESEGLNSTRLETH